MIYRTSPLWVRKPHLLGRTAAAVAHSCSEGTRPRPQHCASYAALATVGGTLHDVYLKSVERVVQHDVLLMCPNSSATICSSMRRKASYGAARTLSTILGP